MPTIFNNAMGPIIVAIAGWFVSWGSVKVYSREHERRIEHLEIENSRLLETVHGLRDIYVSQQHFTDLMTSMREAQRELREDVKRILDLLATRAN